MSDPALEIRYIGDLQRIEARPGDVFVLKMPGAASEKTIEVLKAYFMETFPAFKVIVLTEGMDVDVIRTVERTA